MGAMVIGHVFMVPAMVASMLVCRDEYIRCHRSRRHHRYDRSDRPCVGHCLDYGVPDRPLVVEAVRSEHGQRPAARRPPSHADGDVATMNTEVVATEHLDKDGWRADHFTFRLIQGS